MSVFRSKGQKNLRKVAHISHKHGLCGDNAKLDFELKFGKLVSAVWAQPRDWSHLLSTLDS